MRQQKKGNKTFRYDTVTIGYFRKGKKVRQYESQTLIPGSLALSDPKRITCEEIYIDLLQLDKKQLDQVWDVYHMPATHPHRKTAADPTEKATKGNKAMKKTTTYHYRGLIERGRQWVEGFSETSEKGAVTYPWQPKAVCRREAKARGTRAVFVR